MALGVNTNMGAMIALQNLFLQELHAARPRRIALALVVVEPRSVRRELAKRIPGHGVVRVEVVGPEGEAQIALLRAMAVAAGLR